MFALHHDLKCILPWDNEFEDLFDFLDGKNTNILNH
jgi:hypothetical protein